MLGLAEFGRSVDTMNPYEGPTMQSNCARVSDSHLGTEHDSQSAALQFNSWRYFLFLPCVNPVVLALIYFSFPTPTPGPWPYGQPTLLVEKLIAITMIGHVLFSLSALVYSVWGITRSNLRIAFWLLVIITMPKLLLWGFELSMNKAGKWL